MIVEPFDLHYSRAKLIRLAFFGALLTALGLWAAASGISGNEGSGGRRSSIGRLLGPEGLQWLGWGLALVSAAFVLLYLRRILGDPLAARGDAGGVTINMLFGRRFYAAGDIDRIELQRPMGQAILQVVPVAGRGKMGGLAVNGLAEDPDEVEAWIDSVRSAQRGGGEG
jgi:hypothetical protein